MVKVNSRTIQRLLQGHGQFIREADEARRYYSNVNRIKQDNSVLQRQAETEQALGNPLHLADNRISHSWHNLLVTQKVSYALSYPPVFDVGNKTANERIAEISTPQRPCSSALTRATPRSAGCITGAAQTAGSATTP